MPGLYWRVWSANTIMSVGDGMFVTAMPLLAYTLTRDPRLISLVAAAEFLPWLLLSLHAGVLADRCDRGMLMWRAQAGQAVIVALITALVLGHLVSVWALIAAMFAIGATQVVFSNAAQAVLPQLVAPQDLPKANGQLQVSLTVGETFLGPPLGSALFGLLRFLPFGLGAAAFTASSALLSRLPKFPPAPASAAPGRPGMWADIGEGLRYLFRHRLLRTVAMLLATMNFCYQMGTATLVLLAVQTLHMGTRGYGVLWTASALGAIGGGLLNPAITRRLGMRWSLIIAMAAESVVALGVGLAPDEYAAVAVMGVSGFFVTMWNVVTVSLRQRIVPAELLGRVNSAYRMIGWGVIPLGALTGGFVAKEISFRAPFTLGGIICAVVLLAALPILRTATTPELAATPDTLPGPQSPTPPTTKTPPAPEPAPSP